ncbi:MAG: tRNA pseudouridine(55) synthase TruB, partial [Myxococcota bacterium]
MGRKARRPAHTGVLRIDKPSGVTSHDVVQAVRRGIGQREVGHTGTLDPMATGLLVLTLGRATRIGRFLESTEKVYEGEVVLGVATDTFDVEGKVVAEAPVPA